MHNPVQARSSEKIDRVNYSRNSGVHAHLQGAGCSHRAGPAGGDGSIGAIRCVGSARAGRYAMCLCMLIFAKGNAAQCGRTLAGACAGYSEA